MSANDRAGMTAEESVAVVRKGEVFTLVIDLETASSLVHLIHDAAPSYAQDFLDRVNATIGDQPCWGKLDDHAGAAKFIARVLDVAMELGRAMEMPQGAGSR